MFVSVGHQCELHHRISWYWLNPRSAVRVDVEAFANGADRSGLPKLRKMVDEMLFVPVVERVQEAQHSILKRAVGMRKITGAYVSLAIRSPEIERSSCERDKQAGRVVHQ